MKKQIAILAAALVMTVACSRERAQDTAATQSTTSQAQSSSDQIAVPLGTDADPAARERERFDERWRGLSGFSAALPGKPVAVAKAAQITFVPNGKESFDTFTTAQAINSAPVVVPIKGDVSGPTVLKTQVYLDRLRFSAGALDGRWGRNSAIALWWYQRSRGINAAEPGALDELTFRNLAAEAGAVPVLTEHTVTGDDLKGPFVTVPEEMYDKAKLDCLCYESVKEKLAEKFHVAEDFLVQLNKDADFDNLKAGDRLWVPDVRPALTGDQPDIARVTVSIQGNTFNAYDGAGNLVFHAPTTLGSEYDPSPRETLEVKSIHHDPHFHYQPKLFHEVPDDDPEANLNPGPNSPVGLVWIALSKRHFGIHGTSSPETIGYASSHGCVRLTNWDAKEVAYRISPGVKVEFLDTRSEGGA